MVLLIDNYDSFSYNLYQLAGSLNPDIKVIRNDALSVSEIKNLRPEKIIISPGPGRPEAAGVCIELVKTCHDIPILGVCLGHQAICAAFGAEISYAKELMHGKQSLIKVDTDSAIFKNCPETLRAARYHSLSAINDTIPDCLKITAKVTGDDGEIMAVQHAQYKIYGLQFHPESVMTPYGNIMMKNFLEL